MHFQNSSIWSIQVCPKNELQIEISGDNTNYVKIKNIRLIRLYKSKLCIRLTIICDFYIIHKCYLWLTIKLQSQLYI